MDKDKIILKNLSVNPKSIIFALAIRTLDVTSIVRRDGRVVDYSGLENRRTERYRGFESLSLRHFSREISKTVSLFCFENQHLASLPAVMTESIMA